MNILQVVPHYIPASRFGGVQRVAHLLGQSLVQHGHRVTVCTTNLQDEINDLDVPTDVPVVRDGISIYYAATCLSRYWGFSPMLARRIRKEVEQADVVLVHAHYQFANLVGAWFARRAQKPYIVFAHASLHRQGLAHKSRWLKWFYLRILEHANLSGAKFIAFNAPEEKANSLYGDLGKVIPNGINPAEFAEMPPAGAFRERYPQLKDKVCLLFLGRLDIQHKGLDRLIPAFAEVYRRHPEAHLILAGPDEEGGAEQVRLLSRQHRVEHAVTLTGLLAGADKLAALQDADAFILASRFEGLSIALLEALFMNLPVLVTDQVGLCNEIAAEGAGIVVKSDVKDIQAGLEKILGADTRATLTGKGRNLIMRKYTWDSIARQLISDINN